LILDFSSVGSVSKWAKELGALEVEFIMFNRTPGPGAYDI